MMSNMFENAKFGDKFITRDGRKAIVINLTKHLQGITMALTIEGDKDAFYRFYHEDGTAKKEAGDTDAVDIVSKWKEPVDEEKLEKIANESTELYGKYTYRRMSYDSEHADIKIEGYSDGFKAGYRKAKEEKI